MITVTPISLSEMYVNWNGQEGDYFELLRSESSESGFEIICSQTEYPFYIDRKVNLFNPGIHYYYKVKGYVGGIVASESEAIPFHYHKADPIANKVIYEAKVALRVMDNPPVFVLVKKREGVTCPNCWNSVTKKTRFANCPVCNGTGKIFGYYPSFPIRVSQNVSQLVDTSNMIDGDNVGLTPIDAWTLNRPLLSPGDVLVDITNQRYKIEHVAPRTKSQFVMRQLLQLYPLPKGHPAYNAKVDFEVVPYE